jgi:putative tryptophan/tyrosine transport system substrate-binding protein
MRRRNFISLLGGAAAAWPLTVWAQQQALPAVGVLHSGSPDDGYSSALAGFRKGLNEAGYVERRNVVIEYRWAQGRFDRMPALAADLVQSDVAIIVATGGVVSALAAKAATTTIPIVFANGSDPLKLGLVASFNRPGGNITGVSFFSIELEAKRLELLREFVPQATIFAALLNPNNPNAESQSKDVQEAGRVSGRSVLVLNAGTERDIDAAFETLVHRKAEALAITADSLFVSRLDQIVALAARHRVPTIYTNRESVELGGLISYQPNLSDSFRQAGIYTGRILKGEKPADLPVIQPTKYELVINLKTAKALGLEVPTALLARADEVIE